VPQSRASREGACFAASEAMSQPLAAALCLSSSRSGWFLKSWLISDSETECRLVVSPAKIFYGRVAPLICLGADAS
jgi:hypothetical protein